MQNKLLGSKSILLADIHVQYNFCLQVSNMSASGALGVIFLASDHVRDLDCMGNECDTQLNIPASSVKTDNTVLNLLK